MRPRFQLLLLLAALAVSLTACSRGGDEAPAGGTASPSKASDDPAVQVPTVQVPTIQVPTIHVPHVDVPTVAVPTIQSPSIDAPRIQTPEIQAPGIQVRQGGGTTAYSIPADVLFDFDASDIRADAESALEQISASIAKRFPSARLQISGHTDAKGADAYNQALSERRAASVADWLAAKGNVAPSRMTCSGLGETRPVAPNTHPDGSDDPAGRQRNRRVEIVVASG